MGWTSYPVYGKVNRKHECDLVYGGETEKYRWEVLKSAMVGSTYYAAVRRTDKATGESRVFAGVCLTSIDKGEFYYKDMSEDMGPYQFKCPSSILDLLSETTNEYALTWRKECRKHNKRQQPGKLPIGTTIEFMLGGELTQATKCAPAFQFKTPWWSTGNLTYIKKKNIPTEFTIVKKGDQK